MKFGIRAPSFKKSCKARATGRLKEVLRKLLYPDMAGEEWDVSEIRKRQFIARCIIKPHFNW